MPRQRPGYSSVVATLALFLALSGTAFAGARVLLTGADIRDGSLTSADVRNGSLRATDFGAVDLVSLSGPSGRRGKSGVAGERGPAGPAGAPAALPSVTASGPDVVGYADNTPLVDVDLPSAGTWLLVGLFDVTNTGASGDYLNCLYDSGGAQTGAAGAQTDAGSTASGNPVSVMTLDSPATMSLLCGGSGVTSFDVADISMTAIRLA
jgi:hypothetical protein